jgi:Abnormal spindle-like microcephaly-assoc'd, ASPM-SPD-2-Hydin
MGGTPGALVGRSPPLRGTRQFGVLAVAAIVAFAPPSTAAPVETVIDFDELDPGRSLDPGYTVDGVMFGDELIVTDETARSGNAIVRPGCIDDVGDCPQEIVATFDWPASTIELWVTSDSFNPSPVTLTAFDVTGQQMGSARTDLDAEFDEAFDLLSVSAPGIGSILVVADNSNVSVFVDDIRVVPEVAEPATAAIDVQPQSIDFGEVPIGAERTETLTVSNIGSVPVQVTIAPTSAAIAVSGNCDDELLPGDSCRLEVLLFASNEGAVDEVLTVADGQSGTGQDVKLSATVTPDAEVPDTRSPDTVTTTGAPPGTDPQQSTVAPMTPEGANADGSGRSMWWLLVIVGLAAMTLVVAIVRRRRRRAARPMPAGPRPSLAPQGRPRIVDGETTTTARRPPEALSFRIESAGAITEIGEERT